MVWNRRPTRTRAVGFRFGRPTTPRNALARFSAAGLLYTLASFAACSSPPGSARYPAPEGIPAAQTTAWFETDRASAVRLRSRNTLSVTINGRTLDRVLFDTGASGFVLSPAALRRFGLPRVGSAVVQSPAGEAESYRAHIERLEIGPLVLANIEAVELDTGFVGLAGLGRVNGIIGGPVLDHAVIELRLAERTLVLHDPASFELPPAAEWTPMRRVAFGFVLPARVKISGSEIMGGFLLDTGAELGLQINGATAERLGLANTTAGRRGRVANFGGSFPTRRTTSGPIEVGGVEIAPVTTDIVLEPSHSMDGVVGLLGRDFFEHATVILDVSGMRAAVTPRARGE